MLDRDGTIMPQKVFKDLFDGVREFLEIQKARRRSVAVVSAGRIDDELDPIDEFLQWKLDSRKVSYDYPWYLDKKGFPTRIDLEFVYQDQPEITPGSHLFAVLRCRHERRRLIHAFTNEILDPKRIYMNPYDPSGITYDWKDLTLARMHMLGGGYKRINTVMVGDSHDKRLAAGSDPTTPLVAVPYDDGGWLARKRVIPLIDVLFSARQKTYEIFDCLFADGQHTSEPGRKRARVSGLDFILEKSEDDGHIIYESTTELEKPVS